MNVIQLNHQNDGEFEAIEKGLSTMPPLSHTIRSIRVCHNNLRELICPPNLVDLRACCNKLTKVILNVGIKTATLDKNMLTDIRIPSTMESISLSDNLITHLEPPVNTFVSAERNPWIKVGTYKHRTLTELCIDICIINNILIPLHIANNGKKCIDCNNITHNCVYKPLLIKNKNTSYTTLYSICDLCIKKK